MRNIKLREGSPKAVPRSRLTPDLGARHDVVWDRSRAARHRAHPSGMRTVSSSAHAGRRRPADASCRADMWREDAGLATAGGANSSCGSAKGSSRTMPWRARPRPCHHEVEVAGRGRWRTCRSKRRRERCGRAPCGAGCGLDDHGGRVAALHVREGRAPSFTAARAPAWPTTWGQVCLVGDGGAFKSESRS